MRLSNDIVLPSKNKKGVDVKIKILAGPLNGKEVKANKVEEVKNGEKISLYYVKDSSIETYFLGKDIVEI